MADTDVLVCWGGSGARTASEAASFPHTTLSRDVAPGISDAIGPKYYSDPFSITSGSLLPGVVLESVRVANASSVVTTERTLSVNLRSYIASGVLYFQVWDYATSAYVTKVTITLSGLASKSYRRVSSIPVRYTDSATGSLTLCVSFDPALIGAADADSGDVTSTSTTPGTNYSGGVYGPAFGMTTRALTKQSIQCSSFSPNGWSLSDLLPIGGVYPVVMFGLVANGSSNKFDFNKSAQTMTITVYCLDSSTGPYTYVNKSYIVSFSTVWSGYVWVGLDDRSAGALFYIDTDKIRKVILDAAGPDPTGSSYYFSPTDAVQTRTFPVTNTTLSYRIFQTYFYLWNRTASTVSVSYGMLQSLIGSSMNISSDSLSGSTDTFFNIAAGGSVGFSYTATFNGTTPAAGASAEAQIKLLS